MTFTPVTVTGNRVADGGQQAHGWTITFTLAAPITDGQTTVDPTPITVPVADSTGAFTAALQAPPVGAAIYRVAENLAFRHAYYITLTAGNAPSVDLDTLPHTLLQPPVAPYVRSIVGKDGDVTADDIKAGVAYTKADVGLANVDDTADVDKPVSTAQQAALDGKVDTTRTVNGKPLSADVSLTATDVGADAAGAASSAAAAAQANAEAYADDGHLETPAGAQSKATAAQTAAEAYADDGHLAPWDGTGATDGQVATWDAASGKLKPKAGGGGGLPSGLTSTDAFTPVTSETLIDDCESTTDWAASGLYSGSVTLDTAHATQGTNSITALMKFTLVPPSGSLVHNLAAPVDTTGQAHLAVDVGFQASGPGLPPGITVDQALSIVIADGPNLTGNTETATFPILADGVMGTATLPIGGLTSIASYGIVVTAGDNTSNYRGNVFIDNARFAESTAFDAAMASADTVGVLVPPTYDPTVAQVPRARQDGKVALDMRDNYAYLSGIGGTRHLREWLIVEDGSVDVAPDINRALSQLKPGEVLLAAPAAMYRVDSPLLPRSNTAIDWQGAALFTTVWDTSDGVRIDGVKNFTMRRFNWYGYHDRSTVGASLTIDGGAPTTGKLITQGDSLRGPNTTQGNEAVPMYARQVLPQLPQAVQGLVTAIDPSFRVGCVFTFVLSDSVQASGDCIIEAVSTVDSGDVLASRTLTLTSTPSSYALVVSPDALEKSYKVRVRKATGAANTITVGNLTEYGYTEYASSHDSANVLRIMDAQHITLEDFLVEGAATDGFDVGDKQAADIVIRRFVSRCANRQGGSVNRGDDVEVYDGVIIGPGRSGLDNEPFANDWAVTGLRIHDVDIYNANNWGLSCANWSRVRDLHIHDVHIYGSPGIIGGALDGSIRDVSCELAYQYGTAPSAAYTFEFNGQRMSISGVRTDGNVIVGDTTKIAVDPTRAVTTVTAGGATTPPAGTQETWTVGSTAGFPVSAPFLLFDPATGHEVIEVTAISGSTWTVVRDYSNVGSENHGTGWAAYLAWDYTPDNNTLRDVAAPSAITGSAGFGNTITDATSKRGAGPVLGQSSTALAGVTMPGVAADDYVNLDTGDARPFRVGSPGMLITQPPRMPGGLWLRQPITGIESIAGRKTVSSILAAGSHNTSGSSAGKDLGLRGSSAVVYAYGSGNILNNTTARIVVEVSQDNSHWYAIATLPTLTAKGQLEAVTLRNLERYIRVSWTVYGANPSIQFAVDVEYAIPGNNLSILGAAVTTAATTATIAFPAAEMPKMVFPLTLVSTTDASGTLAPSTTYYYRIGPRTRRRGPALGAWAGEVSVTTGAADNAVGFQVSNWHGRAGYSTDGFVLLRGTAAGVYTQRFDVLPKANLLAFPYRHHGGSNWKDCGALVLPSPDFPGHPTTYPTASPMLNVTEESGLEPDTGYGVIVTPNWATTVAVTAKRRDGFDLAFGTAAPSSATVDCFVVR